ncbi:BREX system P-loop protein BrxC [Actinomadura craniellae]|uniref:BREX system P-loop protein BrxC n=1 Tax=Actinomadura craniellae TaxID=2231787 RepID=A0A365H7G6_9ACTN|nr:BREX system P-loop protein BrxC [Actinomadura craniellae]RAY15021.1 BREX system P-loop protein BrxC [Actinomadura craniellae]
MLIRDLFASDVTRDIPPVVYFHEQAPDKLAAEVSEYIVTGGWPEDHPNHRRVPQGIHEQYVRLLTGIATELGKPGGPELPNVWISGFYGSGKSSFAKLLGLSLDGVALPDGGSLAEAWLQRDTSPNSTELRAAWNGVRQHIDPLAVVFDIGSIARDGEHLHAAAVRQVQRRLGYCTEPLVADFELRLERDGEWSRFEEKAQKVLGKPWASVKENSLAEEDFSLVMSELYPDRYTDPMAWFTSRGGTHTRSESPEEAVAAIRDMLKFRRPGATLFLVIDEVSQYVLSYRDRVDRLRAFATAIGATLRGQAWLVALGQQKLDDEADDSFLVWAKDRFPPSLRVHLAPTNIRDVVHKRLLHKRTDAEESLRALFESNRPDLKLYAYGCESVTPEEFIEVYPMLPGQIDLVLQITTALRTRSARAQGDDQAIRGLLQLLGELFRGQRLADQQVGGLVTLDQIYEVQHTALDADVQASMARVLSQCTADTDRLLVRVAKAVALLELIQETQATDAKLVAQCLYDRVDRGNQVAAVTEALEELRRRNLLGYSEKHGYKLQSSAGEEWERERRDIPAPREALSEIVQAGLNYLLATPDRPQLQGRSFPWAGRFSDGRRADDVSLLDPRDDAAVRVDFRYLAIEERAESTWVTRSGEAALHDRLVWLSGDSEAVGECARELHRSRAMVKKYKSRRDSLNPARRLLLQQEENRAEDLDKRAKATIAAAWMAGRMYFRGRGISPSDHGATFAVALHQAATRVLPDLFPHFIPTQVQPSELLQLVEAELSGPSPKFLTGDLGILELDAGRYVPSCGGVVVRRIQEYIEAEGGSSGTALLARFGGPPYGYTANVVKACVAGLLRATKIRLQPEGRDEITAIRDAGVRDLFERDRDFRRATIFPAGQDDIGFQSRARICRFFEDRLESRIDREDDQIANAVVQHFPVLAQQLRDVQGRLSQLPGPPAEPAALGRLGDALEKCLRNCRQTRPTVQAVKNHLDALQDGVFILHLYRSELTADAIRAVKDAHQVLTHQADQLTEAGIKPTNVVVAATRVSTQLAAERPWFNIGALDEDLAGILACYRAERQRLLQWQERQAEAARGRVRARNGFSTLTADQAHSVLRPFTGAVTDTTVEAVAPPLTALADLFTVALQRAENQANDLLDEILSTGNRPLIARVDLQLRNREVATEADVQALVEEIKGRLLEQVRAGARVRLL